MNIRYSTIDHRNNFETLVSSVPDMNVLSVGAVNYDEMFVLQSEFRDDNATYTSTKITTAGGHAGNAAAALAQLGARTSILAAVGNDSVGEWLVEDLAEKGIDTSLVRFCDEPTGRAIIPVFSNCHFMILERGANERLGKVSIEQLTNFDAIALFDPPLDFLENLASLLEARACLPDIYWTPGGHYSSHPIARKLLPLVHCVFLNVTESDNVNRLDRNLLEILKQTKVVETRGVDGAVCYFDGRSHFASGFKTECVDPTGAGDHFASCFILADVAGLPIEDCLTVGNIGGMIAVETVGARSPKLNFDELKVRLDTGGISL